MAALEAGDASQARRLLRESLRDLAARLRGGGEDQELVRDPDLLESDGPEWTTLEGEAPSGT